jgi:hypothetical protein
MTALALVRTSRSLTAGAGHSRAPRGCRHLLQLTTEHLKQVQATLKAHNLQPGRYVLPQMIITPAG